MEKFYCLFVVSFLLWCPQFSSAQADVPANLTTFLSDLPAKYSVCYRKVKEQLEKCNTTHIDYENIEDSPQSCCAYWSQLTCERDVVLTTPTCQTAFNYTESQFQTVKESSLKEICNPYKFSCADAPDLPLKYPKCFAKLTQIQASCNPSKGTFTNASTNALECCTFWDVMECTRKRALDDPACVYHTHQYIKRQFSSANAKLLSQYCDVSKVDCDQFVPTLPPPNAIIFSASIATDVDGRPFTGKCNLEQISQPKSDYSVVFHSNHEGVLASYNVSSITRKNHRQVTLLHYNPNGRIGPGAHFEWPLFEVTISLENPFHSQFWCQLVNANESLLSNTWPNMVKPIVRFTLDKQKSSLIGKCTITHFHEEGTFFNVKFMSNIGRDSTNELAIFEENPNSPLEFTSKPNKYLNVTLTGSSAFPDYEIVFTKAEGTPEKIGQFWCTFGVGIQETAGYAEFSSKRANL